MHTCKNNNECTCGEPMKTSIPNTDDIPDFLRGLMGESKARDARLDEIEATVRKLKELNDKMQKS